MNYLRYEFRQKLPANNHMNLEARLIKQLNEHTKGTM